MGRRKLTTLEKIERVLAKDMNIPLKAEPTAPAQTATVSYKELPITSYYNLRVGGRVSPRDNSVKLPKVTKVVGFYEDTAGTKYAKVVSKKLGEQYIQTGRIKSQK